MLMNTIECVFPLSLFCSKVEKVEMDSHLYGDHGLCSPAQCGLARVRVLARENVRNQLELERKYLESGTSSKRLEVDSSGLKGKEDGEVEDMVCEGSRGSGVDANGDWISPPSYVSGDVEVWRGDRNDCEGGNGVVESKEEADEEEKTRKDKVKSVVSKLWILGLPVWQRTKVVSRS
jgi:hypothetical protein